MPDVFYRLPGLVQLLMFISMDTEKVQKIWQIIKTIIEVVLAGLGGLVAGATANAAGLTALL